ncbi:hypothetical protein SLS62_004477 [Diatrype stigma]|uniref:FAD-binding PCMH-type domain-containing protein n=1 Tax=Diatrype stigma TaxID=117547 RepID=A0AAN9YTF0_9PEZI
MGYKRLTTATLFARLLSGVLGLGPGGEENGSIGGEDPLSGLARRGIHSARLNELYFRAPSGETCDCSLACSILTTEFGKQQVSTADDSDDPSGGYAAAQSRFWSTQQAQTRPACFFRPRSASDVSALVLVARAASCPFAAKGGGHAAFPGSSNSDGGITVDFAPHMAQVVPSADRRTVSIGPGNTWLHVYETLAPHNLSVVGGRVASVGVSGLLLGGGLSFFTGQYGWACDNVVNYEVVLASGEVVDVSADSPSYADLFWALKGGGGNFGVVTRFDVRAFEQGPLMWGGDIRYEFHSSRKAVASAVARFAEGDGGHGGGDPKAHMIASYAYAQAWDMWITSLMLDHADPLLLPENEGGHPAAFDDFVLADPAPLHSTLRTNSLANLTLDVDATSPFGFRNSYWTLTTGVDAQLLDDMAEVFVQEVAPLKGVRDVIPAISFQVVTRSQRAAMARAGGANANANALGVGGEGQEPLLLFVVSLRWALEEDDEAVLTACRNIVERSEALAKERGLDHPYLWYVYSEQQSFLYQESLFQDVFTGYGPENKQRLIEIAEKHDPTGVFQKLHPGHFKLNGAPAVWKY